MKEIEDLIKEIANYNKYVFINKVTTHYWDCVKKQSFDKSYNQFVRCATWLCYFASINDDNNSKHNITCHKIIFFTKKMWEILELKYSSGEQAKSFLESFKEKVQEYKLYCKDNKKRDYITELLDTVEQQKLCRIYLNLHAQEDLRIKNGMIDIQYSYPINVALTLFEKCIDKLDNKYIPNVTTNLKKNVFQEKIEFNNSTNADKAECKSIGLRLHQILHFILKIALEYQGVFSEENLYEAIDSKCNAMEDTWKKELKDQVVKILELLSTTQDRIKDDFTKLKDYLVQNPNLLFQHNTFHKYPVLIIKTGQTNTYYIPSPHIFLSICTLLVPNIIGEPYYKQALGEGLEQHLIEFINFYKHNTNILNVSDINELYKKESQNESHADILIETEKYYFIVECKNSFGLWNSYNKNNIDHRSLRTVLDSWNRIYKAFDQCKETQSNASLFSKKGKCILKLLVVNEAVLGEIAGFFGFYHEKAFAKLGLEWGKIGCVSLVQFHNMVKAGALEEFANNIITKAKNIASGEIDINKVIDVLNLFFPYYQDQSDAGEFFNEKILNF